MISIKIADTQKLVRTHSKQQSAFISFPYDSGVVDFIKSLGSRVYLPTSKQWEVPISLLPKICNALTYQDISIEGTMERENASSFHLPSGFEFKTEPYQHQIEGVLYGLDHPSFMLGDDQGLGKTKEIIDLAVARKIKDGLKHCLIICGVNGNKYNWADEIREHSSEDAWVLGTRYTKKRPIRVIEGSGADKLADLNNLPKHFFIVTNVETLRALSSKKGNKTIFPVADKINQLCKSGEIGMIAFDEAHKAKSPTSQQGKALLSIKCPSSIPMSGTFLLNNPMDLYVPLKWAGFESHSFHQFKQHYCVMGGFNNKEVLSYKNLDELRELLDNVMLRRTKQDVLDLPPKVHTVEYVDMTKEQSKVYSEVMQLIKASIDKVSVGVDPLSQLIRLRQVTGYPGIVSTTIQESAKMDRMVEIVSEIAESGQKVIVFSQWSEMTEAARKKLRPFNPAYITGDVPADARLDEMNRFQNDSNCKVIVGTIGAMGTGFTLTAASNVLFLDEPWSRAIKDQAEDRAHRIGTTGTVRVITLLCKDTIDERIYSVVQSKGRMSDMIIDGKLNHSNSRDVMNYLLS